MNDHIPLQSLPGPPPPAAPPSASRQQPRFDAAPYDSDDDGIDLMRLFWAVWDHKWLIAAVVVVAWTAGLFLYWTTPPRFEATGLMQIETQEAGLPALQQFEQYGDIFGGSVSIAAEVAILKSRTLMTEIAERLKLDIRTTPRYLPVIGAAIARHFSDDGVARPWFGEERYAWGGEVLEVQSLLLPDARLGETFVLTAGPDGSYKVADADGTQLLQGRVGTRAEAALPGGGSLVLFVARLKARSGTEFELLKVSLATAADALGERFTANETPKLSGILQVGYSAGDPEQAAKILNTILDNYQRRNVERKGAEADQTLAFLDKQLPPLKARLEAAEGAYNDYLREHGTIDITRETQDVLTSIMDVENELFSLKQERETMRARFKPTHPKIRSVDGLMRTLSDKLTSLERETEALPEVQQTVLRLARDVEVNTSLYSQLINAMQELRIAKAGTVGNARVIDYALPPQAPAAPNLVKTVAISTMLGLFAGLGIVFVRLRLRRGIEDPDDIERALGLSVFGTVPFSPAQEKIAKRVKQRRPGVVPLACEAPDDLAVESIRSLRTSLHFLLLEAGNAMLLITGATQGVGKSFLCVNLALVLGQAGKRVLLIDADLRKGHLHRLLGIDAGKGLSEYITGGADRDAVLMQLEDRGLDFIGTGARPPNPSELLMHRRFVDLLHWGGQAYDYVLIDAPPVLAVTDAAIIGTHVGASLLVARAEVNSIAELEESTKLMRQGGANVRGIVLNAVRPHRGYRYGYSYGYQYRYGDRYADNAQSRR